MTDGGNDSTIELPAAGVRLAGDLVVPESATAVIAFAHGSGSSRRSPRNRYVAERLRGVGLGTLLFDLLTADEERIDARTRELRFDIDLLGGRLTAAVDWLAAAPAAGGRPVGLFGASTGAAAALVSAATRPERVYAVVSRGGRPDLAGAALARVVAPTLLVVGGADRDVLALNQAAGRELAGKRELAVVPNAGHLFEEPGALDAVVELAAAWFTRWLPASRSG